jgi:hypothetical protein
MDCKKCETTASAYFDQQLGESEAVEYRAHLSDCSECRMRLVEYEAMTLALRNAGRPEVPRELRSYVMTDLARRTSPGFTLSARVFDWLLKLNPRVVAYSTALVVSLVSFGTLFSTFKPIPMPVSTSEQATIFPVVTGSDREFLSYNSLPTEKDSTGDEQYYELPRVLNNSGLVAFSHIAYSKPGNETMSALVEVGTDGRGKLLDVIDAPKDPFVIEQLWWSLRNRTFQPAVVSGKPVPTRIVLLVEKIDIRG